MGICELGVAEEFDGVDWVDFAFAGVGVLVLELAHESEFGARGGFLAVVNNPFHMVK